MQPPAFRARPSTVLCAATAAGATTAALLALLLGAFDAAGPPRWLAPTPDLMARVERCHTLPERGERERCAQRVVALTLERERRGQALAQR